jgi:hypothetical protein
MPIVEILTAAGLAASGVGAVTQGVGALFGVSATNKQNADLAAARREDRALAETLRGDSLNAQRTQNTFTQQAMTMNMAESKMARAERADDRAYNRGQDHLARMSEIFNKSQTLRERISARFRSRKGVA